MIPQHLITKAEAAFEAALKAAAPDRVMAKALTRLDLPPTRIMALGKAAGPMAQACHDAGLMAPGVMVTHDPNQQVDGFDIIIGGHPVPNENSMQGAHKMMEAARALNEDDHLLMLVSGGGSALSCLPGEGLTLADKIAINERLLASGLDIHAMNAVRRFCSGIKGGRLARAAQPARVTQWVLSDVPASGDMATDLAAIASGPMAPDPVPEAVMLDFLKRAGLMELDAIKSYLAAIEAHPENKPCRLGDAVFDRVATEILASNEICREAAAQSLGGNTCALPELSGEAAAMGRQLAEIIAQSQSPIQAATGGETVVTFASSATSGKGGRSQELALSFLMAMTEKAEASSCDWVLLAAGTDGRDGPTDAAGALVHSGMAVDHQQGLEALKSHDSYPYLDQLGALIKMPPTGTNLADIAILCSA